MGRLRIVASLTLCLCVFHLCGAKYFIAAPNLLRVGVEETVSVAVSDINNEVNIKLSLQDYPLRKKTFSQVEGKFKQDEPGILRIKVNAEDLSDQKSLAEQYVYLRASSSSPGFQFNDEIKILVSYRNAIVFIQTDKPIYNPGQTVNLRVIPLDLDFKASIKNVTIEILNPQGIRVDRWRNLNTHEGFFSQRKDLSKNALLGDWTINAFYGHGLVQNASIQFEVREYILPKFFIKVQGPSYIVEEDDVFLITVTLKYTYGQALRGTAQINVAVLDDAGKTERFSTSLHQLKNGVATVIVSTGLLKNHPKKLWFPDGKRLLIEAKVIEKATGKQEETMHNTIYFTKSPFKISFRKTPRFFKPGVPFEVKVDVAYLNGKPADKVNIEVDAKTDTGDSLLRVKNKPNTDKTDEFGHGKFTIDVPKKFTILYLDIKVRAKIKKGKKEIISESLYQPKMYKSPGQNYLFVRVPKSKVGQQVNAEAIVVTNGKPRSLSYLIVARGKVVFQGTKVGNIGITTIRFTVKSKMSPQARFIAYYTEGNELVVDSAVMEVEERLPNEVSFTGAKVPETHPGVGHTIKIKTSPFSRVGILAVDQSVYLLRDDKHLTLDKVFKRARSHDLGCGAGAGEDNKDVLRRAGLAVMTNINNLKTDPRTDYQCSPVSRRKKRSLGLSEKTKCCSFGEKVARGTCLARAKTFSKSDFVATVSSRDDCVTEFYKCCKKKFEPNSRSRSNNVPIPHDLLDGLDFELDEETLRNTFEDTQIRTSFPETWLYEDAKAGDDGLVVILATVPDTITSWVIQAMAVSNTTGFGLTSPSYLTAFKPFFVSLSMPYSAQRGEQVSIVATVYNYQKAFKEQKVVLFLQRPYSNEFCSYVEPGSTNTMYKLTVPAEGAASVSFPIVPTVVGDVTVQISAAAGFSGDIVKRVLKVLPEGMERLKTYSVILDPHDILRDPNAAKPVNPTTPSKILTSTKGNGIQKNKISLTLPDNAVPESESAQLFVIGNLIGPVVSNVIEGRGLDSIIRLPTGCGEQTMLSLAPNVFVLQYLGSTKQVTQQIEIMAYKFIRSGYQRELNYRRSDHSFSAFGNTRPGSTWLTAFVIKTFCAIQKLGGVDVDQNVICSAINWLSSIQRSDGAIPDKTPVIHQEMNGDINGDIAMTAYVVTALLECKCSTQNAYRSINSAVAFLEKSRPKINRVYVKAVVAYALALTSSPQRFAANNDLMASAQYDAGKNTRYWIESGNAINVETAGYALLTQMVLGRKGYAGPIVVWLTEQRKGGGGFVSTQDTCVALQALAAYSEGTSGGSLDLKVVVTSGTDDKYKQTILITKKNALVQQQFDISKLIGDDLVVDTTGTGVAQLQIETRYNTPASQVEACQFNLTVTTIEEVKRQPVQPIYVGKRKKPQPAKRKSTRRGRRGRGKGRRARGRGRRGRGKRRKRPRPSKPINPIQQDQPTTNSISVKICVKYRRAGKTAGMSIIDVGILTGFSADTQRLKELKETAKPGIAKYEISDRHVVLYVDEIPSDKELCYPLKMKRDFEVGQVQPVPVTVYDYYEPDNKCTKYYGPKPKSHLSLAACQGESCTCYLDKCTACSSFDDVYDVRDKLCKDYDFAFKGTVRGIDEKDDWLRIQIDVKEILKFGSNKRVLEKNNRILFVKKPFCKCPEIGLDKDFLILGNNEDLRGGKIVMNDKIFVKELPKKNPGARFYKRLLMELSKPVPCP